MFNHLEGDKKREAVKNKIINHYPNFPEVSVTDLGHVAVHTLDNSRIIFSNLDAGWSSVQDRLKDRHLKTTIEQRLMSKYAYLKIRLSFNKFKLEVTVWTKQGTAMNLENDKLSDTGLHPELARLEIESALSSKDNMFFCTGHNKAEPIEDYEYKSFAGRYCEQYKEENFGHYINAMNEVYH